jgi:hypothetical protein
LNRLGKAKIETDSQPSEKKQNQHSYRIAASQRDTQLADAGLIRKPAVSRVPALVKKQKALLGEKRSTSPFLTTGEDNKKE